MCWHRMNLHSRRLWIQSEIHLDIKHTVGILLVSMVEEGGEVRCGCSNEGEPLSASFRGTLDDLRSWGLCEWNSGIALSRSAMGPDKSRERCGGYLVERRQ